MGQDAPVATQLPHNRELATAGRQGGAARRRGTGWHCGPPTASAAGSSSTTIRLRVDGAGDVQRVGVRVAPPVVDGSTTGWSSD